MKNGSCSATALPGSAISPFVISTGAQRSGEICGPFVEIFFDRVYPDFLLRAASDDHVNTGFRANEFAQRLGRLKSA
jgi:hypothetical protein